MYHVRCYHCDIQQTTPSNGANQWQKSLTSKLTHGVQSQWGVSSQGPRLPRRSCTGKFISGMRQFTFYHFWCNCMSDISSQDYCCCFVFPWKVRSLSRFLCPVPCKVFVLHPSGFLSLSCTHQDLSLSPIKVSLSCNCSPSGFQQSLSGMSQGSR